MTADKLFKSRVVMLTGEEHALRLRALHELIALATAEGDFDLQTFESDTSAPSDWIGSAGTAPFLSLRRTVVVRHLLRCENLEGIEASLKALPEHALLILVADDESGDDNRQRKLGTARKHWEKLVNSTGGIVAAFAADPKQVKAAIRAEAERLGKKLSEAGAESISEMTGASLSRAIEELEKLAIYVGEELQIRESDIRAVVVPSREWNVFKMVDAIVDGNVHEALRQLRVLVGSQTKAEEAAFSRILPMLTRQIRLLWQARLCVEARCQPGNAPESINRMFPEKPNIAKEPPYRQSRLIAQARRTDLPTLTFCFAAISEADGKLKGLIDAFSAIETLEHMVLSMIDTVMQPISA